MPTINFDITLSKSQQEIYDLANDKKVKYLTVVFSRQSGKSTLMLVLCIQWLMGMNNQICYICRNFVLGRDLFRLLMKVLPKEVIKTSNGSELFVESVFGSTLTFHSAEQGSSLRGQTFTHMVCDEFAFFQMEQTDGTHLWYDVLSPTLKARGKKCIFVSTPLNKNNIFYEMYQRGLSDEYPDYKSVLKTIYDDGFITPEGIEKARKDIPDASFRREYLCEWMCDGISFFQGFSDCFDIDTYNASKRCWIGVDLSANGTDSTICSRINDDGEIELFEAVGTYDMKYRQIADYIDKANPVAVLLENNGVGSPMIAQIRSLVRQKSKLYEWTTTNSSKEEIISDLAIEIANRNIHFQRKDTKLFNELANFVVSVSKSRKLTFNAKGGNHDDMVMATAIALRCKNNFKYIGKSSLNYISSSNNWLH